MRVAYYISWGFNSFLKRMAMVFFIFTPCIMIVPLIETMSYGDVAERQNMCKTYIQKKHHETFNHCIDSIPPGPPTWITDIFSAPSPSWMPEGWMPEGWMPLLDPPKPRTKK